MQYVVCSGVETREVEQRPTGRNSRSSIISSSSNSSSILLVVVVVVVYH